MNIMLWIIFISMMFYGVMKIVDYVESRGA